MILPVLWSRRLLSSGSIWLELFVLLSSVFALPLFNGHALYQVLRAFSFANVVLTPSAQGLDAIEWLMAACVQILASYLMVSSYESAAVYDRDTAWDPVNAALETKLSYVATHGIVIQLLEGRNISPERSRSWHVIFTLHRTSELSSQVQFLLKSLCTHEANMTWTSRVRKLSCYLHDSQLAF
ncbi:hypothetical protein CVT26_015239 [Gymnopilus dilepis]|uniref:Uncharacterized protein n=1 Tax=Gymnopilus dilepis TaxID=231916 RepID=A0A409W498_9AGAR|nr:hypothetical protein CVT26_015239 [Gymnopilus dilepis]